MAHAVFISYAAADKATAEAVCRALEAAAIPCWIAPRDVVAGTRYAQAIVDAIHESKAFLLVFSAAANASTQVAREVDRAASLGLPILPLRTEDVAPSESFEYYLAGQHWLDALSAPLDLHLERLASAARSLIGSATREAAPLSQSAAFEASTSPAAPPTVAGAARRERRVVTVLSCGMSCHPVLSEYTDPEDVDAALRAYEAAVRRIVETHGGVVQGFGGDALTAVFGVPILHEDDAERAVRAGLGLVGPASGLTGDEGGPCEMCVGVHTGAALVQLDVDPARSESFPAGDLLATATHLRSLASATGVVVSESTHALTEEAVEYEGLVTPTTDGGTPTAPVWLARAVRRRSGARAMRTYATPLIGRETELAFLEALFEKAAGSSSPQVVLIVGEPGIGKSRLVAELYGRVRSRADSVTWRRGRCLPYGEGVIFWALGEVFKTHAGILETDDLGTVEAKLGAIVPEGPDREWLLNRLRALLGLEAAPASREENSTAWLRMLEEVAVAGPAIVVIEDLHWADEALLAFIEYLAGSVAEVPLLVIVTARPELFERQPAFAASIGRVNRIALEPLSLADTERLVAGLLETASVPSEVQDTVVVRSEGNPFYAEESVRLLRDRAVAGASHLLDNAGAERRSREGDSAPMPGSVQAIIAARLDALPPEHKAVLIDAAVIGNVFWGGAVAALGDRAPGEVDGALHDLVSRQLIHRVRESSMHGESEFAFGHALARDVAYGQLPRAVRARKHASAAAWIEGKAGERIEDLADILAHHYVTAFDVARLAEDDGLAQSLVHPAVRALGLAGDRAMSLDVDAAERHYSRVLELAGSESPERPRLLVKWANAVKLRGRPGEAITALEEAIASLRSGGDARAAAVAQLRLADALYGFDEVRSLRLVEEAIAQLESDVASPELVTGLTEWLLLCSSSGEPQAAIDVADRAIALSQQLGLPADPRLICERGSARCDQGDPGGVDDLMLAVEMCRTSGLGEHASAVFFSVGSAVYMYEGFKASVAICSEGSDFARRRGAVDLELVNRVVIIWGSEHVGDWGRVLDEAVAVEPHLETSAYYSWELTMVRIFRAQVLMKSGRTAEALDLAEWLEGRTVDRSSGINAGRCIVAAAARMQQGEPLRALRLLGDAEATFCGKRGRWWASHLPLAVRTALKAGDPVTAERLVSGIEPREPLSCHAIVAARALVSEARGDHEGAEAGFADAAARWHAFGVPFEEGQALIGQGRCLLELDRSYEAAAPLLAAHEILARLGAKLALAETDELMQQVAPS